MVKLYIKCYCGYRHSVKYFTSWGGGGCHISYMELVKSTLMLFGV